MIYRNETDAIAALAKLDVGNRVYLKSGVEWRVQAVERATKSQIILGHDRRYRRTDGMRVGNSRYQWHDDYIVPMTPHYRALVAEAQASLQRTQRINTARATFSRLLITEEHIDLVWAMLNAVDKGEDLYAAVQTHLNRRATAARKAKLTLNSKEPS